MGRGEKEAEEKGKESQISQSRSFLAKKKNRRITPFDYVFRGIEKEGERRETGGGHSL